MVKPVRIADVHGKPVNRRRPYGYQCPAVPVNINGAKIQDAEQGDAGQKGRTHIADPGGHDGLAHGLGQGNKQITAVCNNCDHQKKAIEKVMLPGIKDQKYQQVHKGQQK